ncbi:hypothetical protein NXS19_008555 [Fusarium pseudograminearum]|nr:hypothetical protein NXS19_008555 [Fusarium pseudograminearum]
MHSSRLGFEGYALTRLGRVQRTLSVIPSLRVLCFAATRQAFLPIGNGNCPRFSAAEFADQFVIDTCLA